MSTATTKTLFTLGLIFFGLSGHASNQSLALIGKCHYFDGDNDDSTLAAQNILPGRPFLYLYTDQDENLFVIHSIANKLEPLNNKTADLAGELEPIQTLGGSSLNDVQWRQLNLVSRKLVTNDISLSLVGTGAVRMAVGRPTNLSNQQYPYCIVFE